ncbi:hypothetical protein JCM1841_004061 [Sporobolomyces salmonicolor]
MHGVKRSRVPPVPDSAEVERKKRDKEAKRIEEYNGLMKELQDQMAAKNYTPASLQLTTRVLGLNPEFQTGWGMRRRILLDGLLAGADTATKQRVLEDDLQLTNASLKHNPKNYSVWEHRKWVLETMPDADWGMEIKMVELYLEKDGRNFHSWDYRRYLISSILSLPPSASRTKPLPQPTTESELAFTTRKISSNFSNFSAWHYRTKLLAKLWSEKGWGVEDTERLERVDQEFELVKQAIWSDPNDQSAWLYHRWLVGDGTVPIIRREIAGIEELLEEEPDSRWCLDSLVHYKRLLVKFLGADETTREERERLNLECAEMLRKLQEVDSLRRARYVDLGIALWLSPPPSSPASTSLTSLIASLATSHSTPAFDPHVTLLTGIPSTASIPAVLSSLSSALSAWRCTAPSAPRLSLSFAPLGSKAAQNHYFQYLFAQVDLSPALLALRQAVRAALLPELDPATDDYFPHVSLMYGVDTEERSAAGILGTLQEEGDVRQGEDGAWVVRGVTGIEVHEVQVVMCEGRPEVWKVVGSMPL